MLCWFYNKGKLGNHIRGTLFIFSFVIVFLKHNKTIQPPTESTLIQISIKSIHQTISLGNMYFLTIKNQLKFLSIYMVTGVHQ